MSILWTFDNSVVSIHSDKTKNVKLKICSQVREMFGKKLTFEHKGTTSQRKKAQTDLHVYYCK